MVRSKWKGSYCSHSLVRKVLNSLDSTDKSEGFCIYDRSSIILPEFVGYKVGVYNGYKFNFFIVTNEMVGRKFGEFSFTRRLAKSLHNKDSKKKK